MDQGEVHNTTRSSPTIDTKWASITAWENVKGLSVYKKKQATVPHVLLDTVASHN